jgi:hypothetical protein
MNTEYLWWFLALLLAGVGTVAFLALGRVPEIEDETEAITGPGSTDPAGTEPAGAGPAPGQSSPASTTVPAPGAPASTSETP